jgi:hypothetical protein
MLIRWPIRDYSSTFQLDFNLHKSRRTDMIRQLRRRCISERSISIRREICIAPRSARRLQSTRYVRTFGGNRFPNCPRSCSRSAPICESMIRPCHRQDKNVIAHFWPLKYDHPMVAIWEVCRSSLVLVYALLLLFYRTRIVLYFVLAHTPKSHVSYIFPTYAYP